MTNFSLNASSSVDANAVASIIVVEPIPPPTSTMTLPRGSDAQSKPKVIKKQSMQKVSAYIPTSKRSLSETLTIEHGPRHLPPIRPRHRLPEPLQAELIRVPERRRLPAHPALFRLFHRPRRVRVRARRRGAQRDDGGGALLPQTRRVSAMRRVDRGACAF
jgi:hypothetical protein